ncbi:MAG: UTP--glucose-1-phosphate uridylyltransferase [Nitrospirae bacterium RIFCSPLOW2_12_42_9]|nr:MAG: UTP--glucose-1-phosphate uridylyltransferase [Nitrospirae bacterium RIFCSPLOWO2_02_42_7]OGW56596.1 MAG: UTP--glucose-1-phosphate uridylyltransferase [Nitrospirae bacterium RIFCSPLOW2_12_42_9]OGW60295.1 MAG: UTP--glucose-1-phosphate uridylyltransferase [Nitrospirae bacterium RIFCSPHIGHO2_02_FULL_42_12]HAS17523.1 UTP--glucose-1-phosphate uridylyltransferase [Nitrospiraceae bacterium]HBI24221.1 UTP--glucose-1-phosphate uridylyltransferase [Nitrospiraceae bacterium]
MATPVTKAVFPVAGLGTRFLPATKASPKEMLPLVDKPLIQYVIEEAISSGIEEVIIVTGRGKRAIEDHFDISYELEDLLRQKGKRKLLAEVQKISNMMNICYVRQKEPNGLGHAILCTKNLVKNEPFAVLLGDDIIDSDVPALKQMLDIYNTYSASIIAVQEVDRSQVSNYGIIEATPIGDRVYKISDMVEKPGMEEAPSNLAIIGRYILTPGIIDLLEKTNPGSGKEIQLTDALKKLVKVSPVYGYKFKGTRYDAGDKLGFLKATVEFALKNKEFGKKFREYLKTLKL